MFKWQYESCSAMKRTTNVDLRGKDFFDEKEAAHYACCSVSHFRKMARNDGIFPFIHWGKRVYKKADIQRILEDACLRSKNAVNHRS